MSTFLYPFKWGFHSDFMFNFDNASPTIHYTFVSLMHLKYLVIYFFIFWSRKRPENSIKINWVFLFSIRKSHLFVSTEIVRWSKKTQNLYKVLFPAGKILRNTENLERKMKGVYFKISMMFHAETNHTHRVCEHWK